VRSSQVPVSQFLVEISSRVDSENAEDLEEDPLEMKTRSCPSSLLGTLQCSLLHSLRVCVYSDCCSGPPYPMTGLALATNKSVEICCRG